MTQPRRYDQPLEVEFGGQTITARPLRGLEALRAFEAALVEEVHELQARVEKYAKDGRKVSTEALLESGVDVARLLKLALPDVVTDELINQSTARERMGLVVDVCHLNNLGRFGIFLAPEMLLELGSRLAQIPSEFPTATSNGHSLEPASAGTPSSSE